MTFQNLMGLGKSRCDGPNSTTQRWACPSLIILFFELNINELN